MPETNSLTCIVLAGGKSLRLGNNKLTEIIGGKPLLRLVIDRIRELSAEIIVVGPDAASCDVIEEAGCRVIQDIFPGRGPLNGLYSGLSVSSSLYNVVVGGDMPFINASLLKYMANLITTYDAVIPRMENGYLHPLYGIYSRSCLEPARRWLDQNHLSIHGLLPLLTVRYIEQKEIALFDPDWKCFFNINTRTELEQARFIVKNEEFSEA